MRSLKEGKVRKADKPLPSSINVVGNRDDDDDDGDDDSDNEDHIITGGAPTSVVLDNEEGYVDERIFGAHERIDEEAENQLVLSEGVRKMPIEQWLERIRRKYGRLRNEFVACGVHNIAELQEIDEGDFIILQNRIIHRLGDRKIHIARILREMKLVREARESSFSVRKQKQTTARHPAYFGDGHGENGKGESRKDNRRRKSNKDGESDNVKIRNSGVSDGDVQGISFLAFNGAKIQSKLSLNEGYCYWIIEVQRPHGEKAHVGEGMFVWFLDDSVIAGVVNHL